MPHFPLRLAPLEFCLSIRLLPYIMCASGEGSGESARMRRLTRAFTARQGDKNLNRERWHIYQIQSFTMMLSYSLVLYCLKISIPWRIKHDRSWLSCFSGNQCSFYIGNAIKATVLGGIAWMSVCDSGKIGRQKNWWIKNLIYFIWNCDIRHGLRPSIKCLVLLNICSMNIKPTLSTEKKQNFNWL